MHHNVTDNFSANVPSMLSVVRRLPLSRFKRHTDRRGKSKVITRKERRRRWRRGGGKEGGVWWFVADEMPLKSRVFRQNKLRRDSTGRNLSSNVASEAPFPNKKIAPYRNPDFQAATRWRLLIPSIQKKKPFFSQLEGEGLGRACTRLRNEMSVTQTHACADQPTGGAKVAEIQLRARKHYSGNPSLDVLLVRIKTSASQTGGHKMVL